MFSFTLMSEIVGRNPLAAAVPDEPTGLPSGIKPLLANVL
jgi:hypothetical protein